MGAAISTPLLAQNRGLGYPFCVEFVHHYGDLNTIQEEANGEHGFSCCNFGKLLLKGGHCFPSVPLGVCGFDRKKKEV